jgi:hypothetical protein
MKTAFLSYTRADVSFARALAADLREGGLAVWLDEDSLLPGQRWRDAVVNAIRRADYFIALLSTRSVDKRGYVQAEIGQALSLLEEFPPNRIFVIPARLDACEASHPRLRDLHWVDLFPEWDFAIRKILAATVGTSEASRSRWHPSELTEMIEALKAGLAGRLSNREEQLIVTALEDGGSILLSTEQILSEDGKIAKRLHDQGLFTDGFYGHYRLTKTGHLRALEIYRQCLTGPKEATNAPEPPPPQTPA